MTPSLQLVYEELTEKIRKLRSPEKRVIVGIDGRCASGKTSAAKFLSEVFACPVIHMDHFFLRPEMRTPERLAEPGGNIDRERFLEEVAPFLEDSKAFSYRPFDCHRMDFSTPITVPVSSVLIVEGTYTLSPALWALFDLRVALTVSPEQQLRRIQKRNGSALLEVFKTRWIPMEERYFEKFRLFERCDVVINTSELFE